MIKKLVCDRCGLEITEKEDIEIALEGKEAWTGAVRVRGGKPRGVLPCENYVRCAGEMESILDNGFLGRRWWARKLFGR